MTGERQEAQASLYALGALPAEELREFETALQADLQLQLLVTELRAAADAMVEAFPRSEPPPLVKQQVLASIEHRLAGAATPGASGVEAAPWQNWLSAAIAAAFAVLCLILLLVGQSFRKQNAGLLQELGEIKEQSAQLQVQRDALQAQLDQLNIRHGELTGDLQKHVAQKTADLQREKTDLQKQLEKHSTDSQRQITVLQRQVFQSAADKDRLSQQLADAWSSLNKDPLAQIRMATLKPTGDVPSRALAASLWDIAAQKGMLVAEGLAVLPASRTYQIWLYDTKTPATPVNAGSFNADEQGTARIQFTRLAVRVEEVSRFAISTERKGGAATPTRMLLSSN